MKPSVFLFLCLTIFLAVPHNGTAQTTQVPGLVMVLEIDLLASIPVIQEISIRQGNPNNRRMDTLSTYHLDVQDFNGDPLYDMDFFFPLARTIPPAQPGEKIDPIPPVIPIESPGITLILPYFETAGTVVITDSRTPAHPVEIKKIDTNNLKLPENTDVRIRPAPSPNGKLNILILSSGYDSDSINAFLIQASRIKGRLLNTEPFRSRARAVNIFIHNSGRDLGCYSGASEISRLLDCSAPKVMAAAAQSGYLYDEIIVAHNTNTYSGSGYREDMDAYKTNSYSSYCAVYDGPYTVPMAIHEFGHSFGNLCDEYSYTTETYEYSPCVNCKADCLELSAADACQVGCDARADYYRPADSIMLDLSIPFFNETSIHAASLPDGLDKRLRYFIQPK